MNTTRIHILKAGTHTSMAGQAISFSQADLAAIAAAYDPAKHEAPIVIGHPQHNLPAYGWVKSLSVEDDGLYAQAGDVNPAFADMVKSGAFKKVSAAFYAPNSGVYPLRHVGFLGAQPPAIKGLKPTEFADADDISLSTELTLIAFTEPENTTVTPEEKAALETENATLKAQVATSNAALVAAKQAHTHASNVAFAEGLATQGKLKDGDKTVVIAVLDHLANAEHPIEFSEGDGKPTKPLLEAYKATLQANTAAVAFSEFATHQQAAATTAAAVRPFSAPTGYQVSPEQQTQYAKVAAFAEANKLDIATAAITLECNT